MPTTTVNELITRSFRLIKVLGSKETLQDSDASTAKAVLTELVDAWSNEDLLIPIVSELTLELTEGTTDYSIGIEAGSPPATHLQSPRPIEYQASFLRDGGGTDYPLKTVGVQNFASLSRKSDVARPSKLYIQRGWPSDELRFMSAPYSQDVLHLIVRQPLNGILETDDLTDVIDMPPGYIRALIYNLAIDLAPEWGKDPSQLIFNTAVESKKKIKLANKSESWLKIDNALIARQEPDGTYQITQGPL